MRIDKSARVRLEALLADGERGSVVSLLVGYSYDEQWNKLPRVDVAVLSPEELERMQRDAAEAGSPLIHELDGFAFAMPLTDDDGLLDGHVLVHGAEGFTLLRVHN